jgi:alpha-tubulin suppressor-like RCC1 family protein
MATKRHLAKTDENLDEIGVEIIATQPVTQVDDSIVFAKNVQELFFEQRNLKLNNAVQNVVGNDLNILNVNHFKKTTTSKIVTLNVLNIENGKTFTLFVENNYFGFSGQVAGMTTDIIIEKVSGSYNKNYGIMIADGVKSVNNLITEWNKYNAGCQIALISGNGAQIPTANIVMNSQIELDIPDIKSVGNFDTNIDSSKSFYIEFSVINNEIYGVKKGVSDRGLLSTSAGDTHSLALKADGRVYAWGFNGNGRLGDGTTTFQSVPTLVINESDFIAISAGTSHSLALKADGKVYAWGFNGSGRLGDNSITNRLSPVLVVEQSDFVTIAAGGSHSLALKADGRVYAWGNNARNQLGARPTQGADSFAFPQLVYDRSEFVSKQLIPNGDFASGDFTGFGVANAASSALWVVSTAVAHTGIYSAYITRSPTGSPPPWTYSSDLVGTGGSRTSHFWFDHNVTSDAYAVAFIARVGGEISSSGLIRNDYLRVRASNDTTTNPVQGSAYTAGTTIDGFRVIQVNSFQEYTLDLSSAIGQTVRVCFSWVQDSTVTVNPPAMIDNIRVGTFAPSDNVNNFVAVSAGETHSLALKADGRVYAWGFNLRGQLGNNTVADRLSPTQVVNESDFVAVAAGGSHSLALKADGRVFAWGDNTFGQLGDNSIASKAFPAIVVGQSDFVAIAAGADYSLALKADGRVYAWGRNVDGQLGDNTVTSKSSPVLVVGQSDFVTIAAGGSHSLALKADGRVYAWGAGTSGQLGDGTTASKLSPVQVVRS